MFGKCYPNCLSWGRQAIKGTSGIYTSKSISKQYLSTRIKANFLSLRRKYFKLLRLSKNSFFVIQKTFTYPWPAPPQICSEIVPNLQHLLQTHLTTHFNPVLTDSSIIKENRVDQTWCPPTSPDQTDSTCTCPALPPA